MGSFITAYSIEELTIKSTIVIVARAGEKGEIIDVARDVNDHSKSDPELFGIGQIYRFEVIRYLKGGEFTSGVNEIHVVQFEGRFELASQASPSADEIEKGRMPESYTPFDSGLEYILFLSPLKDFPNLKNYFTGIAHPWKFLLQGNCVFPQSPWSGMSYYFHPDLVGNFVTKVENSLSVELKSITSPAYPPPGDSSSNSECQVLPSENAVYP